MLTSLTLAFAVALAAPASPPPPAATIPLPANAEAALRAQANRMFDAWARADDEGFVASLYPGVVRMLGGPARAVETIRAQRAHLGKEELVTTAPTVGKVRACARAAKELQCVFEGEQRIRAAKGHLVVQTATIAFSKDGGATWTFLAVSSDGDVRKRFPEVSPALPLQLEEDPKLVPDAPDPAPAAVTP